MKKIYSLFLLIAFGSSAYSQVTLVLQPDSTAGVDALISSLEPTRNFGRNPEFDALAWTAGSPVNFRSMVKFDLSSIPTGAVIQSATLNLYFNPTSSNGQHSSMSGSNESVLRRIVDPWDEMSVTWNNQPGATSQNEVTVAQSTSATQDYTLDVKALVTDMLATGNANYGFLFRLKTESYYRRLVLSSSDHATETKRPKLTVVYSPLSIADHSSKNLGVTVLNNGIENGIDLIVSNNKNDDAMIVVSDLAGRTIASQKVTILSGSNNIRVDAPAVATGLYTITVATSEERTAIKFVR